MFFFINRETRRNGQPEDTWLSTKSYWLQIGSKGNWLAIILNFSCLASFLSSPPPLKSANGFSWHPAPPPPKHRIFQWTSKILQLFILNPRYYLLKVTKFIVKIYQFELLVLTEKNTFGYKIFFVIKYFFQVLVYFFCKNYTPQGKGQPLFPRNSSKNWGPVKLPPSFWKLVRGSIPRRRKMGCTLCHLL